MTKSGDAPISYPAATSPARDDQALADIAAGRIVDGDRVARWLGGWTLTRADRPREGDRDGRPVPVPTAPISGDMLNNRAGHRLGWADTAVAEYDVLRRTLAIFAPEADQRLGAIVLAAMVHLIVEGVDRPDGSFDVPLLPALTLRVATQDGAMTVIGLRPTAWIS